MGTLLTISMLTLEKEDYLKEIYFDPKETAIFGGAHKLFKYIKI